MKSQKALLRLKIFSGNRVEVLNQQPDHLATQLGKNVPFIRKMLVEHGMRIADLLSDLTKRHGFVAAIGKHFAGSRKDFAPQPLLELSRSNCVFSKFAEKPANLKLTPKLLKGGFQVTSREGRSIYQE